MSKQEKRVCEYVRPLRKSDGIKPSSHYVRNEVLIGEWEEVQNVDAQTIKPDLKAENLDGILIRGYEMKFADGKNWNAEVYDKTAYDEFIKSYFVERGLNMPVDIEHQGFADWRNICGRVLYCEVNSVGLYFVIYVPRVYEEYNQLLWRLKAGIIQGFSKEGYVSYEDSEFVFDKDGWFDYEIIHKMSIVRVSLVTTPANGLPFEKMQETRKNALLFENKIEKENAEKDSLTAMFNN